MPSCAIYCRVSTEKQKEKHTIGSQKRILPALAKTQKLSIYKQYIDDGVSGEILKNMPALRALLDDAEARRFAYILIIDIDRFTRFSRESEKALIVDICRENGIRIMTPDHTYDLANRNDRLQFNIKGTVSLYEKETIRERCLRGIAEKRKQGRWLGGTPPTPYWYDIASKTLNFQPVALQAVRSVLTLALTMSPREITRKIASYSPRMVRRLLEPRRLLFYAGRLEVDGQIIKGQWPAIITMAERERILKAKKVRLIRGPGKSTAASHLLTGMGILRCGYCGRSMKSWTDKKIRKSGRIYQREYYRCVSIAAIGGPTCPNSRLIPAELLQEKILRNLEIATKDLGKLEKYARVAHRVAIPDLGKIKRIKEAIGAEKQKKGRLIAAIEAEAITFGDAKARIQAINSEIESLKGELDRMNNALPDPDPEILHKLADLEPRSTGLDKAREAISICFEKILVYSKNVYLTYRFPVVEDGGFTKRLRL